MANRAQRRKNHKALPRVQKMSDDTIRRGLVRNGITIQDLERERDEGYKHGYTEGVESVYTALYAGVCLALNEIHGFGEKRCYDVIKRADEIVLNRLTNKDLTDEVYSRMKFEILHDEPFDRIQRTE